MQRKISRTGLESKLRRYKESIMKKWRLLEKERQKEKKYKIKMRWINVCNEMDEKHEIKSILTTILRCVENN